MNFSVNQARQVFVATELEDVVNLIDGATTLDDVVASGVVDIDTLNASDWKFNIDGHVTDLIKAGHILHTNYTAAADMRLPVSVATVSLSGSPVAGQTYIIKVCLKQARTLAEEDIVPIYAEYTAGASDNAAAIISGLKASLVKNLQFEYVQPFDVFESTETDSLGQTVAAATLKIIGKERPWTRGLGMSRSTAFDVYALPIIVSGVETDWATITPSVVNAIPNGHMMADLEYFALGERGDQYRMFSYPNVIESEYNVDPDAEYDVLTIHYFDEHNTSFKSEKDLQILIPA